MPSCPTVTALVQQMRGTPLVAAACAVGLNRPAWGSREGLARVRRDDEVEASAANGAYSALPSVGEACRTTRWPNLRRKPMLSDTVASPSCRSGSPASLQ